MVEGLALIALFFAVFLGIPMGLAWCACELFGIKRRTHPRAYAVALVIAVALNWRMWH